MWHRWGAAYVGWADHDTSAALPMSTHWQAFETLIACFLEDQGCGILSIYARAISTICFN